MKKAKKRLLWFAGAVLAVGLIGFGLGWLAGRGEGMEAALEQIEGPMAGD